VHLGEAAAGGASQLSQVSSPAIDLTCSSRNLTKEHLAQMKSAFPEGFQFKLINQKVEAKLVVMRVPASLANTLLPDYVSLIPSETETLKRREEFRKRLVARVTKFHQVCLLWFLLFLLVW
jgi:hypothetical protein